MKMGNSGMPYDNNKNIHMRLTEEAGICVTDRGCLVSSFGIKICHTDSFLKQMI